MGHMEFDMGTRYEYVLRDYAKAREFYEKAVEHGYGLAMFNLGMCSVNGGGSLSFYVFSSMLPFFVCSKRQGVHMHNS